MGKFLNTMTLIFIAAKLFGAISWSWWIVALPTLIYTGLIATLFLVLGLLTAIEENIK